MAIHFSSGSGCIVLLAVLFVPAAIVAYLLHDPKWLLIIPGGLIAFALAIAALPIKRKITPEEWASNLEPHLLGTEGPWDWDDATSIALADPRLEAIRVKLCKFDLLTTEERRKEFEGIIAALKRGEIPHVTDELAPIEDQEKELPRWIQVPAGLVLGLFALLCGFATIDLFVLAPKPISMLGMFAALLLLLGCLWVLEKCLRLLTGRRRARTGGLMTPNVLRVISFAMLILPIVGLFTGYYRDVGALAIFQAVMYIFGFFGIRALARKREAQESRSFSDPKDGC